MPASPPSSRMCCAGSQPEESVPLHVRELGRLPGWKRVDYHHDAPRAMAVRGFGIVDDYPESTNRYYWSKGTSCVFVAPQITRNTSGPCIVHGDCKVEVWNTYTHDVALLASFEAQLHYMHSGPDTPDTPTPISTAAAAFLATQTADLEAELKAANEKLELVRAQREGLEKAAESMRKGIEETKSRQNTHLRWIRRDGNVDAKIRACETLLGTPDWYE